MVQDRLSALALPMLHVHYVHKIEVVDKFCKKHPKRMQLDIIIISLLRTHVRRTCLHSMNITMKHTTVILCYTIESYIA